MAKTFTSPQTGSEYRVVAEYGDFLICYRPIDGGKRFRVRIQGPEPLSLCGVKKRLHNFDIWSNVKDGDHISVVVPNDGQSLANAVADAVRAVMLYPFGKGGEE